MRVIQLNESDLLSDEEVAKLPGRFLELNGAEGTFDDVPSTPWAGVLHTVSNEDVTVLKPDGTPLLIYQKNVLPRATLISAFETFKQVDVRGSGDNRGLAGGILEGANDPLIDKTHGDVGEVRGTRYTTLKQDGTLSRTSYSRAVDSGVVGYYPRYPRIPYCRLTAFTMEHQKEWKAALPFMQQVSRVFEKTMPDRWAAQQAIIQQTTPDFFIPGTVFTTITVNRTWRTAVHQDKGDFAPGFGVMSAMEGGKYQGCELIFPKFRVAVDMRTGGLCLADVHEYHGNAPIVAAPGNFRLSLVFYYRQDMVKCGTAEEERAAADRWSDEFQLKRATEATDAGVIAGAAAVEDAALTEEPVVDTPEEAQRKRMEAAMLDFRKAREPQIVGDVVVAAAPNDPEPVVPEPVDLDAGKAAIFRKRLVLASETLGGLVDLKDEIDRILRNFPE